MVEIQLIRGEKGGLYDTSRAPNFVPVLCSWRAIEASKDSIRGNTIENRGYLFVYLCVMDVQCHFVL